MSSDHTADQPTPAGSATARDVIAIEFWERIDTGDNEKDKVIAYSRADRIIAALTAAGYTIAEAGAVTISLEDAQEIIDSLPHHNPRSWQTLGIIESAIAAVSEPAE